MRIQVVLSVGMLLVGIVGVIFWARDREKLEESEMDKFRDRTS